MQDLEKFYMISYVQKGFNILKKEGLVEFLKVFFLWCTYIITYFFTKYSGCLKWNEALNIEYLSKELSSEPEVSIIIPFRDAVSMLERCVASILYKTAYNNFKIILVNNQSSKKETIDYLEQIVKNPKVSVISYDNVFNYSALHNFIISKINTELILLLNNDTEVINKEWLTELLEIGQDEKVGAVGALLLYPNETVQHAGVSINGFSRIPFHLYKGEKIDGKHSKEIKLTHECFATTGACLLTKKSLYKKVGGFDAENLSISYNDIDYCLKLRTLDYKIIYTSKATLYHYESYSREEDSMDFKKRKRAEQERKFFLNKWRKNIY
ncbi:MAG: glycosyltransferase [bacterium]